MEPIKEITPPIDYFTSSRVNYNLPSCRKFKHIETYEKEERKIGKGSYGSVITTKTRIEGDPIVIKSVTASEKDKGLKSSLIKETSILLTIDSPFAVKLYDFKIIKNKAELYLPYGGRSLHTIIEKSKFTESKFKPFLYDCFIFLASIATRGIIHGDIKPTNILVDVKTPLFIDFGGTQQTTFLPNGLLKKVSVAISTPLYLAPEGWNKKSKFINDKTDVWALGCVWIEALIGFNDSEKILLKILKGDTRNLDNILSEKGLALALDIFNPNPEKRISARQAVYHPYFAEIAKSFKFPPPLVALKEREFKLNEEFDSRIDVERYRLLIEMLRDCQIQNYTNRTYFLGAKLFDIILYNNFSPTLINSTCCLILAAKFNNEFRFNFENSINDDIDLIDLYETERILYNSLCFNVNYSTPYDHLLLRDRMDLLPLLKISVIIGSGYKYDDRELVDRIIRKSVKKEVQNLINDEYAQPYLEIKLRD